MKILLQDYCDNGYIINTSSYCSNEEGNWECSQYLYKREAGLNVENCLARGYPFGQTNVIKLLFKRKKRKIEK